MKIPQSRCRTFLSQQILHDLFQSIPSYHPWAEVTTDLLSLYSSLYLLEFCANEIMQHVFILLCLAAFTQCHNFRIPPYCCIYQHFVTFYGRAIPLYGCAIFCLSWRLSPWAVLSFGLDNSRVLCITGHLAAPPTSNQWMPTVFPFHTVTNKNVSSHAKCLP